MNAFSDQDMMGDWGHFGRPLFDDPEARALSRVGVVDVGSNSVRLVVFDGAARSPAYFYNEKIMCGLGQGLSQSGRLNPKGRARALAALERFQSLAEGIGLPDLTVIATAAVRDAEDGADFAREVKARTGITLVIIDGTEEARLSAQGVLLGWPQAHGLVCDIGGSSMELATLEQGRIGACGTSDLGPLKLMEIEGGRKARTQFIEKAVARLVKSVGGPWRNLYLVGGSWRAIAKVDMHRRGYPLRVLHEYRMTPAAVRKTVAFLEEHADHGALRAAARISSSRMSLLPYAAEVLERLLNVVGTEEIAVSAYGIREGLLFEQMPEAVRARDPLIEACRFVEAKDARLPGFGGELYHLIAPIFEDKSPRRQRVIRAACLLHDASWRAHPDYRAEVCFENATRANLGGLTHEERVYLGLALMHRYSNKRDGTSFERVSPLLGEADQREAEAVGKAMRFGAMLWTQPDKDRGIFRWRGAGKVLDYQVSESSKALFGEIPEARLKSLASSLGAELSISRV